MSKNKDSLEGHSLPFSYALKGILELEMTSGILPTLRH